QHFVAVGTLRPASKNRQDWGHSLQVQNLISTQEEADLQHKDPMREQRKSAKEPKVSTFCSAANVDFIALVEPRDSCGSL
ncbi:hypothetical protein, partial [Yoonia sp.]|uniref:hypothetical protein n=1 Tax=Yoonia sp. TaxID=2212373 RepID=UPI0023929955